jgi:HK97 family phage portal protein
MRAGTEGAASSRNYSTLTNPEPWFREALDAVATASGTTVTPLKALGVATVFACVNSVSRSIASLPLKLYRKIPGGGKEEAVEHPLYSLLHDAPNEEMTSAEFRRAVQANATLRQVGYALIVRNGLQEVVELWPIENGHIRCERQKGTNALVYHVKHDGSERQVPASSILRVSGLTANGITALDPMGAVREVIGLAMALQEHGARFFSNASTPSIGIEIAANMTPAQVKEFGEKWDAANGGRNQHRRSILTGGAKHVNVQQANNEQAQFLESRRYQDESIAKVFGVPPHKVGDLSHAHFTNVEQENQNYVTDTLLPWCTQWAQCLNQKLLSPAERRVYSFDFVFEGLLRGDIATRFNAYATARQWGWMNVNEIRRRENLNPVPGGEIYLQPLNMEEAGAPSVDDTEDTLKTA